MGKKLEPGDIVEFIQKDGNRITLVVYPNSIGVKAENPGTNLKIVRDNNFWVKATAIKGT